MDKCNNYINLSDESQFAAFDMLSDLMYTISELESRGNVHLSHIKSIRNEFTKNFRPTKHVKKFQCRPGVYEALIEKIDLIDLLEASERTEFESPLLQFGGIGCFAIPQIPSPPEITTEYVNAWNSFFSHNRIKRTKRGRKKKSDITKISETSAIHNEDVEMQLTEPANTNTNSNNTTEESSNTLQHTQQVKPTESHESNNISSKQQETKPALKLEFDLIDDRTALLEWASTCGADAEGIKKLQNWAMSGPDSLIDLSGVFENKSTEFRDFEGLPEQIDVATTHSATMDIPFTGKLFLNGNHASISHIMELRKLRFGPNRMNIYGKIVKNPNSCSTNFEDSSDEDDYNQPLNTLGAIVADKRSVFTKNMLLFYNTLEGLHCIYKSLNNSLTCTTDPDQKMAIEKSIANLSVFEDQYKTVFKDNILVRCGRFLGTKKIKEKKKLLALASMIIATPPCDNDILSTIHGELGSFRNYIKKSKLGKLSSLMLDFTQKSLIKKSCGKFLARIEQSTTPFSVHVGFPTPLELSALDLPCQIFSQHKLRVGDSFFYNSDLLLEQLISKSPLFSFTF